MTLTLLFLKLHSVQFLKQIKVNIYWHLLLIVACEGGPSYRYDRVINTCYSVKEIRKSWYAAQLHCQSEKAWLLDLSDHQVASHLMNNFNNYHDPCRWNICWIFKSIFKYMPIYISFGIFGLYLTLPDIFCILLTYFYISSVFACDTTRYRFCNIKPITLNHAKLRHQRGLLIYI